LQNLLLICPPCPWISIFARRDCTVPDKEGVSSLADEAAQLLIRFVDYLDVRSEA
jgi:hypothetical protein